MSTLSTKKILIASILIGVFGLGGYGFLLHLVSETRKDVGVYVGELTYETDREKQLRSIEQLLRDTEDSRESIDAQFLSADEDAVVSYITTLESLGLYMPVTIEVHSVSTNGDSETGEMSLLVRVTSSGSRVATRQLVILLESLPTATSIDSMDVSVSDVDETWNTSFSLRALMAG